MRCFVRRARSSVSLKRTKLVRPRQKLVSSMAQSSDFFTSWSSVTFCPSYSEKNRCPKRATGSTGREVEGRARAAEKRRAASIAAAAREGENNNAPGLDLEAA